jgi:hypothetical protein
MCRRERFDLLKIVVDPNYGNHFIQRGVAVKHVIDLLNGKMIDLGI